MTLPFITDKTFQKQDYRSKELPKADYDNCTFVNCDFSNSYLSIISFSDCEFKDCNLSGVKIKGTTFKDVLFNHCKLLGVDFNVCSDFLFSFQAEHSIFSFSSFFNKNLKKTVFNKCILEKADFTDANLSEAAFNHSDLKHAIFENTNLEKADFRTAINFNINPTSNLIKKAKFSREGALNLLQNFQVVIE